MACRKARVYYRFDMGAVQLTGLLAIGAGMCVAGAAPAHAVVRQTLPNTGVAWVIFVDDLHLDFRHTGRIRNLLRTIVAQVVRDGDLVSVRASGPSAVASELTTELEALAPALKKVTGHGMRFGDIIRHPGERRDRAQQALAAAATAVAVLERVPGNRKALIYVSNGYMAESRSEARALTATARRSGARIFSVDPRGLERNSLDLDHPDWNSYHAETQQTLVSIAQEAGGVAVLDPAELQAKLQAISSKMRQ